MRDVSLFYLKSYIGIHSKIQSKIIGQDIKKNTVKNYRTDIGSKLEYWFLLTKIAVVVLDT